MVEEALSFWTEIQRFEDMLAADPRSLSFAPLAELYRKLGLLDDAVSVAQKGCELHPEYPGGFFALGTACMDKGLKDQARVALERVVLLSPDNLRAQRLLGQLYVEVGENELAQKALGRVLQQNPDDAEIELLLRSIASTSESSASDEEYLEEAEVIEELTEVLEESDEAVTEPVVAKPVAAPVTPAGGYIPESFEVDDFADCFEVSEVSEFSEVPEVPEVPEIIELPEIFEVIETAGIQATPEESAAQPVRNPLTTATLAELYVSQGFLDRAIAIYQELLVADPANHPYRLRCTELKAAQERQKETAFSPALAASSGSALPPEKASAPQRTVDAELSRWLENIRRRKDGV